MSDKLTKEKFKDLYYVEKKTLTDIGKLYSLSQTTVRNRMKQWNLTALKPSQKNTEIYTKITYFNGLGYSDKEIAETLNLDLKYINSCRIKLKLPKNIKGKPTLIHKLTPEILKNKILNLETLQSIAEEYNTTETTIRNYMKEWGIEPLSATERRDLSNPNFLKIKEHALEYKKEVVTLTRKEFCQKYQITINQYHSLKEILSIPKNKTGFSKWRGINPKKLTQEQLDLIIASMLGDGSLRKLKYGTVYKEFHSFKQKTYLYTKAKKLYPFIDKIIPEGNGYILSTVPLKELDDLYNLFYPKDESWKQVPDEIIHNFKIDWLGYWYLDDGTCKDNPLISNHFISKEKYRILQDILKKNGIETTMPGKGNGLRIRARSKEKFYNVIQKFITPDMLYKIEKKYRNKISVEIAQKKTLREQWETLYNLGFPYPTLSDKHWDKRFKNLIQFEGPYKYKENTSLMCNIFYPHMYNHLHKVYKEKEKVIVNRIKYADRVTPASLLTGLKLMSRETRTNFSPQIAKITIDKLCDKPSHILDYSMGFGGRLLGTMAAEHSHHYYGIDPWDKNIKSAYEMLKSIERVIPEINERFNAFNQGSENYIPKLKNKIDVAFSSPPYFDYERYTNEPTQAYIKYPKYIDWLKYYWERTVANIHKYLKEGGILALNIKDIKPYSLEKDMCTIIEKQGFILVNTYEYTLSGRLKDFSKIKTEPIYVYKKTKLNFL